MKVSETDTTHKNRWMVLNHLIYPCDHELWYSLSLHIVLSRKHFTLWLDSINTSPELFTGHGDGTAFKQTSFPWTLYSFRSLLQLLLTIASGLLEGDSPLTWKPCASSCRCLGTCRSLPAWSFSFCTLLSNYCNAELTVQFLRQCVHSLMSPVIQEKKITNPFSSQMEILKLFIPCHRTHDVI